MNVRWLGLILLASVMTMASPTQAQSVWNPGIRPFAPTSPWNTRVPPDAAFTAVAWPQDRDSYNAAAGMPLDIPGPATSFVSVQTPSRWGLPPNPVLPIDDISVAATGSDGDLVVVVGTTVYNFWQYKRTGPNTAVANAWAMCDVLTGSGFAQASPYRGAGTRGMGATLLGGLVTQAELRSGTIDHALALTATDRMLKPGFVAPAVTSDALTGDGPLQEGEYLAIPKATPMPGKLSNGGVILFHALQDYGAYIIDQSVKRNTLSLDAQFSPEQERKLAIDAGYLLPLLKKVK